MRIIPYVLLFLLPVCTQGEEWNMITIRNLYYKASLSKEDSETFKTTVTSIQNPTESIKGYIAVSHMIEAKYVYNPYTKLSYFNKGKVLLENSINIEPNNIELRYLRICVQTSAPSFLGYSNQITTDKTFILQKYSLVNDADLKKRIKDFMLQSGLCTEQEKNLFN
ncbi:hypothetical protein [Cytophaga aurantiaca]|uniref:hypothetical protein n=1 Tax=Cytophaga aurantiaca TaxID=29530 RepID=UPI001FDEAA85|nr:hypothetical protein [Cytophaga aurantiaca]